MLAWEYPPRIIGGLSRVVWALSKELAESGVDVHVVTADHPGTLEHELDGLVKVHRVKTQSDTTPDFHTWVARLNVGMLQYAIKLHMEEPFDVVHAHDWMVTDAAWVLKSGFGIPIVSTIHATEQGRMGGIHTDLQRYVNQMEWRLTYESWKIIVNSHSMIGELKNQFQTPSDKIVLIPNGTDPSHFDFQIDTRALRSTFATEHQRIILYVGRLVNEKGVQVLLGAAPLVLQHYPGTQFLIVGTGYFMDELKGIASRLHVDHNVRFTGYVSDEDLLRLYKIADVVAIPSLYEPFGIVALEGMAANVPVVVSDVGGLKDFVEHMETGITTYAGNSQSLAWGILEVLRNPDLAQRLRENAYSRVQNVYNWKAIAKQTFNLYREVVDSASASQKDRKKEDALSR
ncbi:MAG: glycosyltransferase family 4 protein [Cyanobacteria bacterium]|nr:glycosyltransferase family 4 protein [Cyanobacteriota bacterium]